MIEFFRDVLDGPLYIIVAILSLIFIMAIIGFMMERKKLEKEEKGRIAYVNNKVDAVPEVETKVGVTPPPSVSNVPNIENSNANAINNAPPQSADNSNPALLVKTPVVVFDDPDKKA